MDRLADRGSTISPHLLELLPGEGRARLRAAEAVPGHAIVAGFPRPSDTNLVFPAVLEVASYRYAVVQMLHEARQLQHLALRVLVRVRRVDAVRGVVLEVRDGLGLRAARVFCVLGINLSVRRYDNSNKVPAA